MLVLGGRVYASGANVLGPAGREVCRDFRSTHAVAGVTGSERGTRKNKTAMDESRRTCQAGGSAGLVDDQKCAGRVLGDCDAQGLQK